MPQKKTSYEKIMSSDTGIEDFEDFEEEQNNDDSEILKLQVIDSIRKMLTCSYQKLDKQMSRLGKKEIFKLVLMESTDDIIQLPFYRPFSENYRVHQISLNGEGRKEHIELVKSIASPDSYGEMGYEPEKTGWRHKIKRFINKDWS